VLLDSIREAIGILTFSLNTAEQSLSESLPQVVSKLQEGRSKRLRKLEQQAGEHKKQIDQRSAETCVMNSAHLEEFQNKAKAKLEHAKQEWTTSINALKAISQQFKQ
jgi:electron transfer flavoprotein alpha/beta subunit